MIICRLDKLEFEEPKKKELGLTVKDLLDENAIRRTPRIKKLKLSKEENIKNFGNISRLDAVLKNPVNKRDSNVAFEILDAPSNVVSRQSDRIYYPTYSPCLTATGSDYLYYVDEKVIVLTPKECFRLMGFFNDEIILGDLKDNQLHKLAGNGWDINLMSKFLGSLLKIDFKKKLEINEWIKIKEICEFNIPDEYKITLTKNEILKMEDNLKGGRR